MTLTKTQYQPATETMHSSNKYKRNVQRYCRTLIQIDKNALLSVNTLQIKEILSKLIEFKMSGECYYSNTVITVDRRINLYDTSVRTARRKRTQIRKTETIQRVCEMRNWNFVMGA